ncbi:MAG: 4'-phosphopantetheinyl transferase superfamily protein [Bacteroidales bacterium]|nr:4'-phosphopantetheinyl transferase superfamily protein [Bacteroidales bacterium]
MGLLINQEIEEECRIGLWEIAEDYETLFRMTYLNDEDIRRLNTFKNISRKVESLSVRALLQQMTRPDARIVYRRQSRKPYFDDGSYNISVSHSHKRTSVMLSKNKLVGIDLEFMSHNIERVAHKFINEQETVSDNPSVRCEHLYIHWCAKEALYKICDKVDINFQKNLTIQPFEVDSQGDMIGVVHNNFRNEEYKMHYLLENNYVLVYCIK